MPFSTPIHPGKVDWSGENPGIMLKESEDGPWSALALFFRVVYSPAGRGHALLLYEDPNVEQSLPHVHNVMLSDNDDLARYLMVSFIAKLGSFGGVSAFKAVSHLPITDVFSHGDPRSRYTETIRSNDLTVELVWDQLGTPTALELPRELTGTKEHEMFSLLVESRDAQILINSTPLKGRPVARQQAGLETTTAFLYFSETWVSPAN